MPHNIVCGHEARLHVRDYFRMPVYMLASNAAQAALVARLARRLEA